MFYVGCPMWGYKEWVGNFFPARTPASEFLRLYSRKLSTVEGNTTFYATPSAETVARWAQETPASFRFCPKIARSISHEPGLGAKRAETLAFVERMRRFGSRLGPLFLQLPPTFTPAHMADLQAFLAFWPAEVRLAVEVRYADFFQEPHTSTLDTLLSQHNVARVLMDTRPIRVGSTKEQQVLQARERKPDLPLHIAATTDFAFVRYIGHPRMEENEPFLDMWAHQLGQWITQGRNIYAFCHCPYEEHSPAICVELHRRVRTLVPIPPLSVEPPDTSPAQARLF